MTQTDVEELCRRLAPEAGDVRVVPLSEAAPVLGFTDDIQGFASPSVAAELGFPPGPAIVVQLDAPDWYVRSVAAHELAHLLTYTPPYFVELPGAAALDERRSTVAAFEFIRSHPDEEPDRDRSRHGEAFVRQAVRLAARLEAMGVGFDPAMVTYQPGSYYDLKSRYLTEGTP